MLGRRNLDRADRDEMIRRLAARGVKQKNIAEKTGLSKGRITQIVSESNSLEVKHESSINATTPAAEIEAKQAKLDSLRKRLKDESRSRTSYIRPGRSRKITFRKSFLPP